MAGVYDVGDAADGDEGLRDSRTVGNTGLPQSRRGMVCSVTCKEEVAQAPNLRLAFSRLSSPHLSFPPALPPPPLPTSSLVAAAVSTLSSHGSRL